jgi:hypothetical protein
MVMGEAAGVAAAMAFQQGESTTQIDPKSLCENLKRSGAKLKLYE